jgi:hypothetical protein
MTHKEHSIQQRRYRQSYHTDFRYYLNSFLEKRYKKQTLEFPPGINLIWPQESSRSGIKCNSLVIYFKTVDFNVLLSVIASPLLFELATETPTSLVTSIPWGCTRLVSATNNFIHTCDFATCLQKVRTIWMFCVLNFVRLDGTALPELLLLCPLFIQVFSS